MKRTDTEIDSLLKEVGEREAKATPGPWATGYRDVCGDWGGVAFQRIVLPNGSVWERQHSDGPCHDGHTYMDDSDFITASRADIPALLSVIAQLRQQNPSPIPPVILRALRQYRDEHCFDDSEYGVAIDAFLAAPERSQCTCGDSDFGQYCPIHQPATPPAQPPSEAKVHPCESSCREWKADDSEPNPRAEAAEAELTALRASFPKAARRAAEQINETTDEEVMDEFVWEDAATILRVFRGGQ